MNLFQHVVQGAGDGARMASGTAPFPGHGIDPDCDTPVSPCGDGVLKEVQ